MKSRLLDELDRLEERIPDEETEADEVEQERERIRAEARQFLGLEEDAPLETIQREFAGWLWGFWLFFFPHFRLDEQGRESPGAPYQEELCTEIQRLVTEGRPGEEIARAYPREHAKSVFATLVSPLWAALNEVRRFPFLFSDTDTQAWGFLEDIRLECETNERLQAIYPDAVEWKAQPRVNRLVFGNDAVIMAAGSGKSVRGARKRHQRPDLIVLDDIENDEEVENPKRRRKKMVWYNKVVRKLGAAAVYVIVGTILHAESFLAKRIKSEADIHAAVVQDAERQDLWQQWEEIFHDRARPDREEQARAFYEANRAEMDRGAVVLWPTRFSLYQLYVERAEDLASYLSERQNRPFDPTASWFPEDRIRFLESEEMPSLEEVVLSVAFWDPSRGTSKSDTSAVGRLDVTADGRRVVSEAVVDRIPPEEVMDVVIGWHQRRPFAVVGVERVALSNYDEDLQARARAANIGTLPVEPVTPHGDKQLRIKSLRPAIVSQTLQFASSLPLEAIRQLKFFPQHPNDDFPDLVQQAMQLADQWLQDVVPGTATKDPESGPLFDRESVLGRERLMAAPAGMPRLEERVGIMQRAWS